MEFLLRLSRTFNSEKKKYTIQFVMIEEKVNLHNYSLVEDQDEV